VTDNMPSIIVLSIQRQFWWQNGLSSTLWQDIS